MVRVYVSLRNSWQDVEEKIADGSVSKSSSDLELHGVESGNIIVDLQVSALHVPKDETISSATLIFHGDEDSTNGVDTTQIAIQVTDATSTDSFEDVRPSLQNLGTFEVWSDPPLWLTDEKVQSCELSACVDNRTSAQ